MKVRLRGKSFPFYYLFQCHEIPRLHRVFHGTSLDSIAMIYIYCDGPRLLMLRVPGKSDDDERHLLVD